MNNFFLVLVTVFLATFGVITAVELEIPNLKEVLSLLPTTGQLRNPMFLQDRYSLVISPEYIHRLSPIIQSYAEERDPASVPHPLEQPFSNCLYQDFANGGAPHVEVFSKDEVKALQIFGINLKDVINTNPNYDFYVTHLSSWQERYYSLGRLHVNTVYKLNIESPDLDALRESLNLPKQSYGIELLVQKVI